MSHIFESWLHQNEFWNNLGPSGTWFFSLCSFLNKCFWHDGNVIFVISHFLYDVYDIPCLTFDYNDLLIVSLCFASYELHKVTIKGGKMVLKRWNHESEIHVVTYIPCHKLSSGLSSFRFRYHTRMLSTFLLIRVLMA